MDLNYKICGKGELGGSHGELGGARWILVELRKLGNVARKGKNSSDYRSLELKS